MNITTCIECNGSFLTHDGTCPYCGQPLPEVPATSAWGAAPDISESDRAARFNSLSARQLPEIGSQRCWYCFAEWKSEDARSTVSDGGNNQFHQECAQRWNSVMPLCQFCNLRSEATDMTVTSDGAAHEQCIAEAQRLDKRKRHDQRRRLSWYQQMKESRWQ